MREWLDTRRSAVLLHVSSLPGPFASGVLGEEAQGFIDRIADAGFSVWQFLPLGPTHGHGSPYESLSSFAGNPDLIDLRECVRFGWLDGPIPDRPDHARLREMASQRFWQQVGQEPELARAVEAYRETQKDWLEDFALFSALKRAYRNRPWWEWPEPLRDRDPDALRQASSDYAPWVQQVIFEQLIFDRQWLAVKQHAEHRGVQLFGDLPIYVAHDSADVWTHPSYFTINHLGLCDEVAGVPPDYFSESGQRWGNPLYRWERLEAEGFGWWIRRIQRQLSRMHMLRIDHFRGLEAYWAIPGNSEDGVIGEWRKAPGDALLGAVHQALGSLPLIAEDLGIITEEVTALRQKYGLPGMKILQFAFGSGDDNPYLPANHEPNAVVYTGTHDNDTTLGWFASLDDATRAHALEVLNAEAGDMPWALIEAALGSVARLAVIPMQDLLELGSEARFNTPGTLEGNWRWRLDAIPSADAPLWQRCLELNRRHDRLPA